MATIKIKRKREYNNMLRDYKIFIDGKQAGVLANGETKNFVTTAGKHTVIAKIDWCSSPDVHLEMTENELKIVQVGSFKNGYWMLPTAGGIIALHFILKMLFNIEYMVVLILPVFGFLVYYLTIGRKKYLTLTEIT